MDNNEPRSIVVVLILVVCKLTGKTLVEFTREVDEFPDSKPWWYIGQDRLALHDHPSINYWVRKQMLNELFPRDLTKADKEIIAARTLLDKHPYQWGLDSMITEIKKV